MAAFIKGKKQGNVFIEAIIAFAIIGAITASLLNYFNFSRNIFTEAKEATIAASALDSIMTYFETHAGDLGTGGAWIWPDSASASTFSNFANSTETTHANLDMLSEGDKIADVLDQLSNWSITYRIRTHNEPARLGYRDRMVTLRISWVSQRQGGATVTLRKEVNAVITSRTW